VRQHPAPPRIAKTGEPKCGRLPVRPGADAASSPTRYAGRPVLDDFSVDAAADKTIGRPQVMYCRICRILRLCSAFEQSCNPLFLWYPEPGSNRHGREGRGILSPLCLPIPPSGRRKPLYLPVNGRRESACGTFPSRSGAGKESRTLDLYLGKVSLYQLSYSRIFSLAGSRHRVPRILNGLQRPAGRITSPRG
jgi:hypothetical protein